MASTHTSGGQPPTTDEPIDPVDPAPDPGAFDASDPSKVAQRKSRAQRLEASRLNGLTQILANADSRHWLWDVLEQAGIFATSFREDALRMAFLEGRRDLGLRVLADVMRTHPDAYLTMTAESKAREK